MVASMSVPPVYPSSLTQSPLQAATTSIKTKCFNLSIDPSSCSLKANRSPKGMTVRQDRLDATQRDLAQYNTPLYRNAHRGRNDT